MTDKANQSGAVDKPKKVYPRLNFRVNDAERTKIEMDAASHGFTTPSEYLRWLALKRPQTRAIRRPFADERLLAQLKGEAGRVGGNVAQLLRLANRGEIVLPDEFENAAQAVRDFYIEALTLLKGAR